MMNTFSKSLYTNRLTIRPLSVDDWEGILAIRSNPTINQYLDRQPCNSKDEAIEFIQQVQKNIAQSNACYWTITLIESQELVGTICLFAFSDDRSSCEIGYELLPTFHGKGIMAEAASEVINFGMNEIKLSKIYAYTHVHNEASIRLLRRLFFIDTMTTDPSDQNMKCYVRG